MYGSSNGGSLSGAGVRRRHHSSDRASMECDRMTILASDRDLALQGSPRARVSMVTDASPVLRNRGRHVTLDRPETTRGLLGSPDDRTSESSQSSSRSSVHNTPGSTPTNNVGSSARAGGNSHVGNTHRVTFDMGCLSKGPSSPPAGPSQVAQHSLLKTVTFRYPHLSSQGLDLPESAILTSSSLDHALPSNSSRQGEITPGAELLSTKEAVCSPRIGVSGGLVPTSKGEGGHFRSGMTSTLCMTKSSREGLALYGLLSKGSQSGASSPLVKHSQSGYGSPLVRHQTTAGPSSPPLPTGGRDASNGPSSSSPRSASVTSLSACSSVTGTTPSPAPSPDIYRRKNGYARFLGEISAVLSKRSIADSYDLDTCWFCGRPMTGLPGFDSGVLRQAGGVGAECGGLTDLPDLSQRTCIGFRPGLR